MTPLEVISRILDKLQISGHNAEWAQGPGPGPNIAGAFYIKLEAQRMEDYQDHPGLRHGALDITISCLPGRIVRLTGRSVFDKEEGEEKAGSTTPEEAEELQQDAVFTESILRHLGSSRPLFVSEARKKISEAGRQAEQQREARRTEHESDSKREKARQELEDEALAQQFDAEEKAAAAARAESREKEQEEASKRSKNKNDARAARASDRRADKSRKDSSSSSDSNSDSDARRPGGGGFAALASSNSDEDDEENLAVSAAERVAKEERKKQREAADETRKKKESRGGKGKKKRAQDNKEEKSASGNTPPSSGQRKGNVPVGKDTRGSSGEGESPQPGRGSVPGQGLVSGLETERRGRGQSGDGKDLAVRSPESQCVSKP
jgi:hypothetical protein